MNDKMKIGLKIKRLLREAKDFDELFFGIQDIEEMIAEMIEREGSI